MLDSVVSGMGGLGAELGQMLGSGWFWWVAIAVLLLWLWRRPKRW